MAKSVISNYDCFSDLAMLGPRWTRWPIPFELYADGKGLIVNEDATDATLQRGELY